MLPFAGLFDMKPLPPMPPTLTSVLGRKENQPQPSIPAKPYDAHAPLPPPPPTLQSLQQKKNSAELYMAHASAPSSRPKQTPFAPPSGLRPGLSLADLPREALPVAKADTLESPQRPPGVLRRRKEPAVKGDQQRRAGTWSRQKRPHKKTIDPAIGQMRAQTAEAPSSYTAITNTRLQTSNSPEGTRGSESRWVHLDLSHQPSLSDPDDEEKWGRLGSYSVSAKAAGGRGCRAQGPTDGFPVTAGKQLSGAPATRQGSSSSNMAEGCLHQSTLCSQGVDATHMQSTTSTTDAYDIHEPSSPSTATTDLQDFDMNDAEHVSFSSAPPTRDCSDGVQSSRNHSAHTRGSWVGLSEVHRKADYIPEHDRRGRYDDTSSRSGSGIYNRSYRSWGHSKGERRGPPPRALSGKGHTGGKSRGGVSSMAPIRQLSSAPPDRPEFHDHDDISRALEVREVHSRNRERSDRGWRVRPIRARQNLPAGKWTGKVLGGRKGKGKAGAI